MQTLNQYVDFNLYLIFVLTEMPTETAEVCGMAGLILKSNIRNIYTTADNDPAALDARLPPHVRGYIQQQCLRHIGDARPLVRATVSSVVTMLLLCLGIDHWPEAVPSLLQHTRSPDVDICKGALGTLRNICEDMVEVLVRPESDAVLAMIIQEVLSLCAHASSDIRATALECLHCFTAYAPAALTQRAELVTQARVRYAPCGGGGVSLTDACAP